MNIPRPSHATVVAYIALVVAMSGTAVAATGGNFILGKENKANKTSVLKTTSGVPLSLEAPKGKAPLKVNRTNKVANLNADLLDGKSSGDFVKKTQLPPSFSGYEIMVAGNSCPAGTTESFFGYGAINQFTELFGDYHYEVYYDNLLSEYRLRINEATYDMAACEVP